MYDVASSKDKKQAIKKYLKTDLKKVKNQGLKNVRFILVSYKFKGEEGA